MSTSFSDFARIWQDAGPVMDTTFGERLLIEPRRDGPYVTGGADPDRPTLVAIGIIDERTISERREGRGSASADIPDRLGERCVIDFAERTFANASQQPRAGDRIRAVDRQDQAEFEVVYPEPSGQGRVAFRCVRVRT